MRSLGHRLPVQLRRIDVNRVKRIKRRVTNGLSLRPTWGNVLNA